MASHGYSPVSNSQLQLSKETCSTHDSLLVPAAQNPVKAKEDEGGSFCLLTICLVSDSL